MLSAETVRIKLRERSGHAFILMETPLAVSSRCALSSSTSSCCAGKAPFTVKVTLSSLRPSFSVILKSCGFPPDAIKVDSVGSTVNVFLPGIATVTPFFCSSPASAVRATDGSIISADKVSANNLFQPRFISVRHLLPIPKTYIDISSKPR